MDIENKRLYLNRFLVEFSDSANEIAFRKSTLDVDLSHARRLLVIISAVLSVFLIFEIGSLKTDSAIISAAVSRFGVIAVGVVFVRALSVWRNVPMLDTTLVFYVIIYCIGNTFLNLCLAEELQDSHWLAIPAGGYLIAIFAVYVATPLRFVLQFLCAMIFTAAYYTLAYVWPLENHTNNLFVGLLLLAANVIGLAAAYRIQELRRAQWRNLQSERKVTSKLQTEIIERERLETELRVQANTDPLTGIYNRRLLFQEGEDIFKQAKRYKRSLGLLLFDIDHFKLINDNYGHAVGDQVIQSIVGCVGGNLREADLFYRYGGEEFAILLPETDLGGASKMAERIRRAVADMTIKIETKTEHATISVGVTVINDTDQNFDALILRADDALYTAKEKGRNTFVTSV